MENIIKMLKAKNLTNVTVEDLVELKKIVLIIENNIKNNQSKSIFTYFNSINNSKIFKYFIELNKIDKIEFNICRNEKKNQWCNVVNLQSSLYNISFAFEALSSDNNGYECLYEDILKQHSGDGIFINFLIDSIENYGNENDKFLLSEEEDELINDTIEIETEISKIIKEIGEYAANLGIYK